MRGAGFHTLGPALQTLSRASVHQPELQLSRLDDARGAFRVLHQGQHLRQQRRCSCGQVAMRTVTGDAASQGRARTRERPREAAQNGGTGRGQRRRGGGSGMRCISSCSAPSCAGCPTAAGSPALISAHATCKTASGPARACPATKGMHVPAACCRTAHNAATESRDAEQHWLRHSLQRQFRQF